MWKVFWLVCAAQVEIQLRPVNPCQQVHVKPPLVLLHVLFAPQLFVPLTHSLMSTLHCGPSNLHFNALHHAIPACAVGPRHLSLRQPAKCLVCQPELGSLYTYGV